MQVQLTFDAHNPALLADFWATALKYTRETPREAEAAPASDRAGYRPWRDAVAIVPKDGTGIRISFQKETESKRVKNRLHLDVLTAPGLEGEKRMAVLEARADELSDYGATRIKRWEPDGDNPGYLVMADPEGNEFCLN